MTRDFTQDEIDDSMIDPRDDFEEDGDDGDDCGLMPDGQCTRAGSEDCDFSCPNRHSGMFVGSKAWREKHRRKRK